MVDIPKIEISQEILEPNFKLYFFLKWLVKIKLSERLIHSILEYAQLFPSVNELDSFKEVVMKQFERQSRRGQERLELLNTVLSHVETDLDIKLLIFSVKLILIKDLLLQEAKISAVNQAERLKTLDPLSLEYDKVSIFNPYLTRVHGALLSLIFFEKLSTEFIAHSTDVFLQRLGAEANALIALGVEPNQIFMLLFNESMNQSIVSDSGSNYESRIKSVLLKLGIPEHEIKKKHDESDRSTEFDFFFSLDGKTYGIGAKRTLRERYKQFIKTAKMSPIDVMIEITLGTDLSREKMEAIVQHHVILFVSDEVYQSTDYLKACDRVYSCKDLTLETLKSLA